MAFKQVFCALREVFPQVDLRILKAVASQYSSDVDAAVGFVFSDVLPAYQQGNKIEKCSHIEDKVVINETEIPTAAMNSLLQEHYAQVGSSLTYATEPHMIEYEQSASGGCNDHCAAEKNKVTPETESIGNSKHCSNDYELSDLFASSGSMLPLFMKISSDRAVKHEGQMPLEISNAVSKHDIGNSEDNCYMETLFANFHSKEDSQTSKNLPDAATVHTLSKPEDNYDLQVLFDNINNAGKELGVLCTAENPPGLQKLANDSSFHNIFGELCTADKTTQVPLNFPANDENEQSLYKLDDQHKLFDSFASSRIIDNSLHIFGEKDDSDTDHNEELTLMHFNNRGTFSSTCNSNDDNHSVCPIVELDAFWPNEDCKMPGDGEGKPYRRRQPSPALLPPPSPAAGAASKARLPPAAGGGGYLVSSLVGLAARDAVLGLDVVRAGHLGGVALRRPVRSGGDAADDDLPPFRPWDPVRGGLGPERGAAAGTMAQLHIGGCVAVGVRIARTAAGESRVSTGDCGARGCRHLDEGVAAATHPPRILEVRSAAGESRALAGDCGARGCHHLVEGVVAANHLLHYVLGETLDLVYPDRMMAAPSVSCTLLGASFLEHRLSGGGLLAMRCFIFVEDGESWRRGAAESRRWARFDERAQEGGAGWRHGGVDGRPGKELLASLYESTIMKMKEVELQEENSRLAKQNAYKAHQNFLSMVEHFNQLIENSKESNDKQAQVVCEEKSVLVALTQDLQSQLTKLSAQRDEALTTVQEIKCELDARLATSMEEEATAMEHIIEEEKLALLVRKEKEATMGRTR
ncbi:unnamed protein product [Alopecurus aequalis]